MSIAADALQPYFATGLMSVEGRPAAVPLADLIGTQSKIGFDLDFDNANRAILTDFRDPAPVLNSIAYDSSRLASSAFQSMRSLSELVGTSEEVAWGLIRAYYASFYAGHSLLRLFGESCSHFDRTHMAFLATLAKAMGKTPSFTLSMGTYRCVLNSSSSLVTSTVLQTSSGGAHEVFWKAFAARLKIIGDEALLGPLAAVEAQAVYAKLAAFQQSISNGGAPSASWLSAIRNDIQYRQGCGVWLPVEFKKHQRELLSRLAGQWKRDPMDIDVGTTACGKVGEFVTSCAFVVALCRTMLERLRNRSPKAARSFVTMGPLAILELTEPVAA